MQVNKFIDHTLLKAFATEQEILKLCDEAIEYNFKSVCVNPANVKLAKQALEGTDVLVCTVIGFPLGANVPEIKALEAMMAIRDGADEIDMVISIGAAKEGRFSYVSSDIASVVRVARREGDKLNKKIILKVILETCLLDDYAIENCCLCAKKAGADFVKTSTGFANPKGTDGNLLPNGASEYHIKLMRKVVGAGFGVKASGGIRSTKMALAMIEAGANRIGTSSGINILDNFIED